MFFVILGENKQFNIAKFSCSACSMKLCLFSKEIWLIVRSGFRDFPFLPKLTLWVVVAGMPYVASPPITSRSSRPTPRFLRTIQRCLPVTAANQWQIRKNIYLPHPSTHMSKLWSPVNANFGIKSILAQQVQTDPEKAKPVQLEAVESVFY